MEKDIYRKRLFIFLFIYFALFSSYYTTDTFTKCVGLLNKSASASIAKWDVSVDSNDSTNFDIVSGNTSEGLENQTCSISITSNSEVGVNYNIIMSNIPTGVQVIFENNIYNETNNIVTINNAGSIDAGDNSVHYHSLTFIAPSGTAAVSNNEVTIDIDFIQKSL